jgi:hypothetical protein
MAGDLSADHWSLIDRITTKKVSRVAEEVKAKQRISSLITERLSSI